MVLQSTTLLLTLTLLLSSSSLVSAQDCNICGDGNFIGFPTGIVKLTYEGQERTNNCQTWQGIVKNPVAISDDFCRNEMINFTAEKCRCYTADGKMVIDILKAQEEDAGDDSDGGFGTGEGSTSTGADTGENEDGGDGFGSSEEATSTGAGDSNADAGKNESSNGTTGEEGGEAVTLEDTENGEKDGTSSAVAVTTTIMSVGTCLLSYLVW